MNISLKLSGTGLATIVSIVTACSGEQEAAPAPTATGFAISGLLTVPADVIWTQKANPVAT